MPVKRALVVDDSRTARVVLGRMLERYKLAVDAAESAAEALEFLSTNIPPHVIFMDHMMPGMDGLEALQEIKKDARTAMIPIIMYTSKDGALYMGQARALGAVGVLPKPISPLELEKIIHDLNLLADQASALSAVPDRKPAAAVTIPKVPPAANAALAKIAREATVTVEHDTVSLIGRLHEDQRTKLKEDLAVSSEDIAENVADKLRQEQVVTSRSYRFLYQHGWLRLLALAVSVATVAALVSWYAKRTDLTEAGKTPAVTMPLRGDSNPAARGGIDESFEGMARQGALADDERTQPDERRTKTAVESAKLRETIRNLKAQMSDQRRKLLDTVEWTTNLSNYYGFDQIALGDSQLLLLNELISRLAAIDFKGTLRLKVYSGDFCLFKNEAGEYKVAPEEMPIENCQTGLNLDLSATNGPRQSLDFARFLANGPYNDGNVNIDVVTYGKDKPRYKYPTLYSIKTAGEWNRIARLNNRVEISIIDASR